MQLGVECYSGYMGEETPRRLRLGSRRVLVVKVLDRWLSVPRLKLTVERDELSWESLAGVSVYDVIRGELGALLASGGDFAQAGVVCRIDDTSSNVLTETDAAPPGQAYWFLVRDMNEAGNGSYESGGIWQRGLRDAEIKAAPSACP